MLLCWGGTAGAADGVAYGAAYFVAAGDDAAGAAGAGAAGAATGFPGVVFLDKVVGFLTTKHFSLHLVVAWLIRAKVLPGLMHLSVVLHPWLVANAIRLW